MILEITTEDEQRSIAQVLTSMGVDTRAGEVRASASMSELNRECGESDAGDPSQRPE